MKRMAAVFLISGILAVGIFGFLGMNPGIDHDGGNCIASLVNIAVCPPEGISNAIYHMSAYASFSQAVFSSSLVLLLLLALAFVAHVAARSSLPAPNSLGAWRIRRASSEAPLQEFLHWLSLFENSPSLFRSA